MLIVPGPQKVDLIFPGEPHRHEPPWSPSAGNLEALDAHFWDWTLWLRAKEARCNAELVGLELAKLHAHLLGPLGVTRAPETIADAVAAYLSAREAAERRFGVGVPREVENEVLPALDVMGETRFPP